MPLPARYAYCGAVKPPAHPLLFPPDRAPWVFAYGSLMWNPEFVPAETRAARVVGLHRSFCVYSQHYRGTPERPGLVLGLDQGGACSGRVLRVAEADRAAVSDYLWERELAGGAVYETRWVKAETAAGPVEALAFVVDPRDPQYAGRLAPEQVAAFIRQGVGARGSNRDYLAATLAHLTEMGIRDSALEHLAALVEAYDSGILPLPPLPPAPAVPF
ncbi:MAG: gamma-glutamylcyclotransferase [Thalassobaculales bacterium]